MFGDSYHIKQFNKINIMAEGSRSFGGSMQTSGKLHQMLMDPNITPENLFSVSNINGDVKQNIQAFLKFCRKRRDFTLRLLKICLNSTYEELNDENTKRAAQYSIDVLTNDEDALCDFLFDRSENVKKNSESQDKIQQIITPTIQSQAERLFNDGPVQKQQSQWQNQPDAFQKNEIIALTLAHLKQQNQNQTCLGYINKIYSSLLRRQGNLFLQFLKQKPQYIDILINNICHYSIGNVVALALSCEDKSGQYKHEQLKKQLFSKILAYGIHNISNTRKFEGFLVTIQQILNSTKQSYYQYFQDFKRCANTLVNEENLKLFYASLDGDEISFGNAASYLQLIIKRINSESEEHDYYKQTENSEPTMKFQHNFFFNEFTHLLELIQKSKKYKSIIRVSYLNFLINLLKNLKQKQINISNQTLFKNLMKYYEEQKIKGLVKNYLFQLLKLIIKRLKQSEIKQISKWLIESNIEEQQLKQIYNDHSLAKRNVSQNTCFILSLFFDVHNKQNTFLKEYKEKSSVNLTDIFDKYRTKLANYGQEDEPASPCTDEIQLVMKFPCKTETAPFFVNEVIQEKQQQIKEEETQVVGKNHVVIPVLNLPTKNNQKITIEEEHVEQVNVPIDLSRQALIRDLKNTKIQLPDKFKLKKVKQNQKKETSETQSRKQQKQQLKQLQQNPMSKQNNQQTLSITFQAIKFPPLALQTPLMIQSMQAQQQKYFIRHILLF